MTAIQIPRRYMPRYRKPRLSPSKLCEIDSNNLLSRGLVVFMLPVPGGALDIVSGRFFSKNSSYSTVPDFGQLARFNSAGGQAVEVLSNVGSWPSSPGITAGCVARYSAATVGSDDCMVDFRNDANTWRLKLTTQSPTGQSYRVFAKNSSSKSINYSGGPDPNDNQIHRVIASIGNNSDLRIAVDNFGIQTTSAGSGSPQIADDFKLGSDGGGGSAEGAIYCAYGFSRQLSETEMLALNANPWQLVRPLTPWVLYAISGAILLSIASATQASSVDNLDLVQANTLAINQADQAQSADNIDLTQSSTVAVDSVDQAQSADNVVLSTAAILAVSDADQVQSVDAVALIQANILAVLDALHSASVDSVNLVQANSLAVQEADHSQSADNVDLSQAISVVVADADQAATADNVDLLQANTLAVASADHAATADNVTLELAGVLSVADALQQASADNTVLLQANTIAVSDALSAQFADGVGLSVGFNLIVDEANQAVSADSVALDAATVLAVLDAAQSVAVDSVALVQSGTLIVSDSLHASLVDAVNLSLPGVFEFPGRRVMVVQNAVRSYVVVNSATRNLTEY